MNNLGKKFEFRANRSDSEELSDIVARRFVGGREFGGCFFPFGSMKRALYRALSGRVEREIALGFERRVSIYNRKLRARHCSTGNFIVIDRLRRAFSTETSLGGSPLA